MRGPSRGDDAVLVIPQRERIQARVEGAGLGAYVLWLREQPRTPWAMLSRHQAYLEFAGIDGVGRMLGTLEADDDSGHRVRFRTRGGIQLLCRPEALRVRVSVPVTLLRSGSPDAVALEARTVEISGGALALRGLPMAAPGQLYQFDLHVFTDAPAITGQFRVHNVMADGTVIARFTIVGPRERARLVHFLTDRQPSRAA